VLQSIKHRFNSKSLRLVSGIEASGYQMTMWWLSVVGACCLMRLTLSVTPLVRVDQYLVNIVPYVLLLGAPVITFMGHGTI
jgi:Na+(H+)/acetate symporter ActP